MLDVAKEISQRITLLRFPLIVGVVFIHAYGVQERFVDGTIEIASSSTIVSYVQNLFSQVLARIAVPLFYAISGYLFFFTFDGSKRSYAIKLQSRLHTLLIPYVIWNALTILCFFVVQSFSLTSGFLSGQNKLIADYGVIDYLNAFFGYGPGRKPIAYPLWYIRDLILLVLLAPVINAFACNWPRILLGCSAAAWLSATRDHLLPIDPEAWLFFCLGAVLTNNIGWFEKLDRAGLWTTCLYFGIASVDAVLPQTHLVGLTVHKAGICAGIIAAWFMIGKLPKTSYSARALLRVAPFSFFVFAGHALILTTVKKLAYKLMTPESASAVLLIYLVAPIVAIAITLVFGACLRRFAPHLFKVLSGGRAQISK